MPARAGWWTCCAWALGLTIVAAPPARAEDPCAADVRQFCSDAKPGSPRISSCLRENLARLSATCREKLDADALRARQFIQEFGKACRSDTEQFCAGVEPGGGRVFGCLAQHQFELSSSCDAFVTRIAEAKERIATLRSACTADVERLCPGLPPRTGPILECLKDHEASLSSGCNAAGLRQAVEAGTLLDVMEEMSSQDRIREALQILQGLDSVAFSRSQILLQYDSYEALKDQANASRLLFNPQFVFGDRREFSFQLKVPVTTIYPDVAGAPTQSGLGAVVTSVAWNFLAGKQVRQYLGLGLQWQTASRPALGAPWALAPSYAIALSLARGACRSPRRSPGSARSDRAPATRSRTS